MDPLSVASGVAGLVTFADVVISRTYNTIIACKHASEDSRRLLREVQALAGILQSLSSLESKLGAAALQSHIPAVQILSCQQTLQNIRDKLEMSDPKEDGISIFQKAKRTLKWPLSASDTEKFLSEMERHKATFDLALSVDALDAILSSQKANGKTETKIDHVVQTLDRLCKIENTKEQRKILQLVGTGDADEAYRANLKLHQHGTGLWFLEEGKPFSTWLSTPHSKLWVHGIPGAGKTILSALAIGKAAESASTTHGVVFYYCSHRDEQSRHLAGILRCLIGQLARQNMRCMTILEEKFGLQDHASHQTWTRNEDELQIILRKMIRQFGSVSVIVDGVDECHEATTFTDALASLADEVTGVRILISSRKEPVMEPFLDEYVKVCIAAESQDLRLYVPAQIELRTRLRKLRIKNSNVKDKIINTLVNEADGMFRWVACQLDHLCDLTTDDERLAALKTLPRTLELTYDRILERAIGRGESACTLLQRSLLWIIHENQLNIRELCEAVSVNINATSLDPKELVDAEEILIVCSSLIRLSAGGDTLESAHFTVEEYLRTINPLRKPHLARFRLCNEVASSYKAATCLTAILFDDVLAKFLKDCKSLLEWLGQFPFYYHAASWWFRYTRSCQNTDVIETLTTKLFCTPALNNFELWVHVWLLDFNGENGDHMYLYFEVHSPIAQHTALGRSQLARVKSEMIDDSFWRTMNCARMDAIDAAANLTKLHISAMLHQAHLIAPLMNATAVSTSRVFGTPLHCALMGADILYTTTIGAGMLDDLKCRTATPNHLTRSTVKVLLELGADANATFPQRHQEGIPTALIAYFTGYLEEIVTAGAVLDREVVDTILEEIGLHGRHGLEGLEFLQEINVWELPECDRPATAELLGLLGKTAKQILGPSSMRSFFMLDEPDKLLRDYENALINACIDDNLPFFLWMLGSSGISVGYEVDELSLLSRACSSSSTSLAEYLISHGANVNEPSTTFTTPLGYLLTGGEFVGSTVSIMKLLLAAGASTTSLDSDNNNSVMIWAKHSDSRTSMQILKDILEIVVTCPTDLSKRNNYGETVWHALAANPMGQKLLDLVESNGMLCQDTRSSVNLIDNEGWTPLHVAASAGRGKMMQALINFGSEPTLRIPDGRTILHLATEALTKSSLPFEIAVAVDWEDTVRDADAATALTGWVAAYCESHEAASFDMASRLEDALIKLSAFAPAPSFFESGLAGCIDIMARGFAGVHRHDPASCQSCTIFLECFVVLLRGPNRNRISSDNHLATLITMSDGLLGWANDTTSNQYRESGYSKASCAVLEFSTSMNDLGQSLEKSWIVDVAIATRQASLIHALLDLDISVDEPGFCANGLTILQRLCQCLAPASTVEKALSRTKTRQARAINGDTLLHLPLRPAPNVIRSSSEMREAMIRLLIDAGVDVNATSFLDGATPVILSSKFCPRTTDLLLTHGADVTTKDYSGRNAILHASQAGCSESIKSLLPFNKSFDYARLALKYYRPGMFVLAGPFQAATFMKPLVALQTLYDFAEVEQTEEERLRVPSALWVACTWPSNLEQVQYLLEKNADVRYRHPVEGTTPLHVAAAMGSLEIVQALLEAGSDCRAQDCSGLTAEMHALNESHHAVAEVLRSADSGGTVNEIVLLQQAQLLKFRARETLPDAISTLIQKGDLEQLGRFVSGGGNLALQLHSCECTPISLALVLGKADVVTYLQGLGVQVFGKACHKDFPNSLEGPPNLGLLAAQRPLLESLRSVLENSSCSLTPQTLDLMMHWAIASGNISALDLLLTKHRPIQHMLPTQHSGMQVYRLENGDWYLCPKVVGTVLHTAVQMGQLQCVRLLLWHGFDPDALDRYGSPPSHTAVTTGRRDILEILLNHGGAVDTRNPALRTTLGVAILADRMDMLGLLLARGACLSATDFKGQTLLHLASQTGRVALFFLLIEAGLEPTLEDVIPWYRAGYRQTWTTGGRMEHLATAPGFLLTGRSLPESRAVFKLVPTHRRRLNLACRCRVESIRTTALYHSSTFLNVAFVELLDGAGAMLNLEGGMEGTPLMGACKAGRLEVVKYLVHNGALLNYEKNGVPASAFLKAASYPKIQRWLLVERFTDQRMIVDGETTGEQATGLEVEEDNWSDEIADVTLDLVLEDDVEKYLESKNWFLPRRRWIDDGQGAFVRVPIMPEEFARYRPLDFKVSST